jgi:hypothetical protein
MAARLLAAVDSCVADVVAGLPTGWDFADVLDGPDGVSGTADDGILAAPDGCAGRARPAPGASLPTRAIVRVEVAIGAGRRRLDGLAARDTGPGAGALVWLAGAPDLDTSAGIMSLDGDDALTPLASLAAPVHPETLDAWVAAEGTRLQISPGTAAPVSAPPPPLIELGTRILSGAHVGAEALDTAPPAAPAVVHVAGDLVLDGTRQGAGLLFVDGVLEVRGTLAFAGVVAATAGVHVAAGATLAIDGTLWLGTASPPLLVDGALTLRRAADAVAAADAMRPLPRRAVLVGARDLS